MPGSQIVSSLGGLIKTSETFSSKQDTLVASFSCEIEPIGLAMKGGHYSQFFFLIFLS